MRDYRYDNNNGGGETDWNLYGPDDTAMPEPTQHALERKWSADGVLAGGRTTRSFLCNGRDDCMCRQCRDSRFYNKQEEERVNVINAQTAEVLEFQAERLLARAAEVRRKYERFGEDDFPDGAVIIFDKVFHEYMGKAIAPSKPYHYAALKFNNLWSTTGPRSPKSYTWDELIRWMGEGVEEIYYVTEMKRFV